MPWLEAVSGVLLAATSVAAAAPTAADIDRLRETLRDNFNTQSADVGTSGGGPPMLRTLVRLGFHDCASERCDACIDTQSPSNPGLGAMISVLDGLYPDFSALMSRADFWAAAASIAAEECSQGGAGILRMPLLFGRSDATCPAQWTAEQPEANFPSSQDGLQPTLDYFKKTFDFGAQETVAIMGAHSLGVGSEASKLVGAWSMQPNTLDNSVYYDLSFAKNSWTQEQPFPDSYQWTGVQAGQLMLNSDMSLLKDIFDGQSATASGKASCTYATCPESASTASFVQAYANNNTLFLYDFRDAFVKMLTKGYDICNLAIMPSSTGVTGDDPFGIEHLYGDCAASSPTGGLVLVPGISPSTVSNAPPPGPGDGREMEGYEPPEMQAEAGNAAHDALISIGAVVTWVVVSAFFLHL